MAAPLISLDDNWRENQAIDGVLRVVGFAQTPSEMGYVNIYVNDQYVGQATYGLDRIEPELGDVGFVFNLNTEKYSEGPLRITAQSFDNTGNLIAITGRVGIVDRMDQLGFIETPASINAGLNEINGWAIADNGFEHLEFFVNGRIVSWPDYAVTSRPDVANAFPEYGTINSGFRTTVNLAGEAHGYSELTLVGVQADGTRQQIASRDVFVDAGVSATGYVESLSGLRASSLNQDASIKAWVASNASPVQAIAYLDDRIVASTSSFTQRADVAGAKPEFASANGFTLDVSDLLIGEGRHDLRVVVTLSDGKKINIAQDGDGILDFTTVSSGQVVGAHLNPQIDYRQSVTNFQNQTQTDLDIVMYYQSFNLDANARQFNQFPFLPNQVRDAGATPMVTWESNGYSLDQILAGQANSIIDTFASQVGSFQNNVLIRFDHEFNGNYYPWSPFPFYNNDPDKYIEAWRYVVNRFDEAGVDNARFVWAPNSLSSPLVPEPSQDFRNYYPGDGYVDFVGASGYNWGDDPIDGSGWASARSLYDVFVQQVGDLAPGKPILISEIGTDPYYPGESASSWIRDTFQTLDGFNQVKGVVWFNDYAFHDSSRPDFRVARDSNDWPTDVPNDRTVAFRDGAAAFRADTQAQALDNRLSDYDFQFSGETVFARGPEGRVVIPAGVDYIAFSDGVAPLNDGTVLFNPMFYYVNNLDVWNASLDAYAHFQGSGWREGRDPNPYFSTQGYLRNNQDVAAAGVNPLDHYNASGWREGRSASSNFDTQSYLNANPDVAAAQINPLAHFLQSGMIEGRQAFADPDWII